MDLLLLSSTYLDNLRVQNYSSQTVYSIGKMLRYFREFCEKIGVSNAGQVTSPIILHYQSFLSKYRKKSNGAFLAIGTQQHWLTAVSRLFAWLTKQGVVARNPAADLEMPKSEFRLPKVILSVAEVEKIMNVPDLSRTVGIRDRAILETFISSGIRRQELCNISLGDVDYERGLLRIEQGKGKKDRYVPVGARALQWTKKYQLEARSQFRPARNQEFLFLNTTGTKLNPNRLGSQIHDSIHRAAIGKSGNCHLFRHTFATLLLENGCDVRYVQEMLGHSNLETTAIYTHVSLKKLKEMHSRFQPHRSTVQYPARIESDTITTTHSTSGLLCG